LPSLEHIKRILADTLGLGERIKRLTSDTALLGNLAEFDSMAVVHVIAAIEEYFGIAFDDEDITAQAFQSIGTLSALVDRKQAQ
jgi:acyl carrier protein